MTSILTRLAVAMLVAAPVLSPAAAATLAGNAEPVRATVAVSASGLDLATATGQTAFDRRVWTAIVELCGTASLVDLEGQNDVTACRATARAEAAKQSVRLVARLTAGRPELAAK